MTFQHLSLLSAAATRGRQIIRRSLGPQIAPSILATSPLTIAAENTLDLGLDFTGSASYGSVSTTIPAADIQAAATGPINAAVFVVSGSRGAGESVTLDRPGLWAGLNERPEITYLHLLDGQSAGTGTTFTDSSNTEKSELSFVERAVTDQGVRETVIVIQPLAHFTEAPSASSQSVIIGDTIVFDLGEGVGTATYTLKLNGGADLWAGVTDNGDGTVSYTATADGTLTLQATRDTSQGAPAVVSVSVTVGTAPATASIGAGTTEAEALTLAGYSVESLTGASGSVIRLGSTTATEGTASGTFTGATNTYKVEIDYLKDKDNGDEFEFRVNGVAVSAWTNTAILSDGFATQTILDVSLANGDTLALWGRKANGAFARYDKITLTAPAAPTYTPVLMKFDGTNHVTKSAPFHWPDTANLLLFLSFQSLPTSVRQIFSSSGTVYFDTTGTGALRFVAGGTTVTVASELNTALATALLVRTQSNGAGGVSVSASVKQGSGAWVDAALAGTIPVSVLDTTNLNWRLGSNNTADNNSRWTTTLHRMALWAGFVQPAINATLKDAFVESSGALVAPASSHTLIGSTPHHEVSTMTGSGSTLRPANTGAAGDFHSQTGVFAP